MTTSVNILEHTLNNSYPDWLNTKPLTPMEHAYIFFSQPSEVISLTLCLLSLLANTLSIVATMLGPDRMVTHLKLVISLGLSDILLSVSMLSNMLNNIFTLRPSYKDGPQDRLVWACSKRLVFAFNTTASVISLLNLLVMALDHYVAIVKPLHYPHLLNRAKGNAIIYVIWLIAILGGCSVFLASVSEFADVAQYINYCEFAEYSDYQGEYLVFFVAFVTFFFIVFVYIRIYLAARRPYRGRANNPMNYAQNRKALLTTFLIIGTFVVCWLPSCLFQIALIIQIKVDMNLVIKMYAKFARINRYLNTLIPLNALCDPLVYACRLRHVQLGYRRLFKACLFLWREQHSSSQRSRVAPSGRLFIKEGTQYQTTLQLSPWAPRKVTHHDEDGCRNDNTFGEIAPMMGKKTEDDF